jgi:hypothetical protein
MPLAGWGLLHRRVQPRRGRPPARQVRVIYEVQAARSCLFLFPASGSSIFLNPSRSCICINAHIFPSQARAPLCGTAGPHGRLYHRRPLPSAFPFCVIKRVPFYVKIILCFHLQARAPLCGSAGPHGRDGDGARQHAEARGAGGGAQRARGRGDPRNDAAQVHHHGGLGEQLNRSSLLVLSKN